MSYFPQGLWLTLPGMSAPVLVCLRLGLVITDLMEARMVSATPSNFAIACSTKLNVPQHPVPGIGTTVATGAGEVVGSAARALARGQAAGVSIAVSVDAAAVLGGESKSGPEHDDDDDDDGDSEYESDEEDASALAHVLPFMAFAGPRVFDNDLLERAVHEVQLRPPVSWRIRLPSSGLEALTCTSVQCKARRPEERLELLKANPMDAGGSIQDKRVQFRRNGWMPFVWSVFSAAFCAPLMGPFTIHQRLVRDELHMVRL